MSLELLALEASPVSIWEPDTTMISSAWMVVMLGETL
jgi:hypothetical protein